MTPARKQSTGHGSGRAMTVDETLVEFSAQLRLLGDSGPTDREGAIVPIGAQRARRLSHTSSSIALPCNHVDRSPSFYMA